MERNAVQGHLLKGIENSAGRLKARLWRGVAVVEEYLPILYSSPLLSG